MAGDGGAGGVAGDGGVVGEGDVGVVAGWAGARRGGGVAGAPVGSGSAVVRSCTFRVVEQAASDSQAAPATTIIRAVRVQVRVPARARRGGFEIRVTGPIFA